MTNSEICHIFREIADLLELKGENPYKARAYRNVVRSIEELAVPITELVRQDRLEEIPGAGEAIKKKIAELVNTGKLDYYEKLRAEFPEGVRELLAVPGIGPTTARMLYGLGITSVDGLEKALKSGRHLPRVGEKTRENLREAISGFRKGSRGARIGL